MKKYLLLFFIAASVSASTIYPIEEGFWHKLWRCNVHPSCYRTQFGTTITTINGTDRITDSRTVINTNFSNLNTGKFELSDWYSTTSAKQLTTLGSISLASLTATSIVIIPTSSSQSPTTAGQVAHDTTSDQVKYGTGSATNVLGNGNQYASFTYATATAWIGTTTIPLATSRIAEKWNDIQCFTDVGTLFVDFYHTTTHPNTRINASTTANTNSFTSNNTLTAGEKRYVDVGTPATSPTKISCTLSKSITAD